MKTLRRLIDGKNRQLATVSRTVGIARWKSWPMSMSVRCWCSTASNWSAFPGRDYARKVILQASAAPHAGQRGDDRQGDLRGMTLRWKIMAIMTEKRIRLPAGDRR